MKYQVGCGYIGERGFKRVSEPLLIARGQQDLFLLPALANRHGLVAGATGTGKTVTLQVMGGEP
jgi:hypothetical protein